MKLKLLPRLLIVVVALSLAATYYFPLWEIDLIAPQYPEGLGLEIWINGIKGQNPHDLNNINGLNHYIGMKEIIPDAIPELKLMPWITRGLMVFGVLVGVLGNRKLLLIWLVLFALLALAGLVDYYLWGYDYGHDLDTENAAIKIPGMSYQPPLIGRKQLLNFTAVSLPGFGGFVAALSLLIGGVVYWREWLRSRQLRKESTCNPQ